MSDTFAERVACSTTKSICVRRDNFAAVATRPFVCDTWCNAMSFFAPFPQDTLVKASHLTCAQYHASYRPRLIDTSASLQHLPPCSLTEHSALKMFDFAQRNRESTQI